MTALTVIVVVETLLLALLAFVVVGLLRSHAEILRRLPAPEEALGPQPLPLRDRSAEAAPAEPAAPEATRIPTHLPGPRGNLTPAYDLSGRTLGGDAVVTPVGSAGVPVLVAFLSSGCLTCRTFWEGLRAGAHRPMPEEARVVVVTKGRDLESPSRLQDLAPADVPVVMSTEAWADYGVTMSPFFVMVGADGEVRGEGAASSWDQVRSLLDDAMADEELARAEATASSEGGGSP